MKDNKVAICVSLFPNPVQTYVVNLIVAIKRLGLDTVILASRQGETGTNNAIVDQHGLLEDTSYIDTEWRAIPKELLTLPLADRNYLHVVRTLVAAKPWREFGWRHFVKSLILAQALVTREFDLLHSQHLTITYQYLLLSQLFSRPIVTTFHGKEPRTSNNLPIEKARVVFEKGDAFLVNTQFAKDQLTDMGWPEDKISIIPQGISLADFPFTPRQIDNNDRIILLTVGRLSIEKGHHIAIEAVSRLAGEFAMLEYHIVGNGPEQDSLAQLARHQGIEERVKFHGLCTNNKLNEILATAHLFVLPSIDTKDGYHVETQGVVLLEAQASGIPVIGSRTGGIPDVIKDEETGLLFNEGNQDDLADKIKQLIRNKRLYQKLSASGRTDVEQRFSIDNVVKRTIEVYQRVGNN